MVDNGRGHSLTHEGISLHAEGQVSVYLSPPPPALPAPLSHPTAFAITLSATTLSIATALSTATATAAALAAATITATATIAAAATIATSSSTTADR